MSISPVGFWNYYCGDIKFSPSVGRDITIFYHIFIRLIFCMIGDIPLTISIIIFYDKPFVLNLQLIRGDSGPRLPRSSLSRLDV
jgi:hypothetical protein